MSKWGDTILQWVEVSNSVNLQQMKISKEVPSSVKHGKNLKSVMNDLVYVRDNKWNILIAGYKKIWRNQASRELWRHFIHEGSRTYKKNCMKATAQNRKIGIAWIWIESPTNTTATAIKTLTT